MPLGLPTGQRGRLFALAITFAALIIIWFGAVSPLIDLYDARAQELDEQRAIAAHMAGLAAQLPELTQRAAAHTGPAPTLVLQGSSDAVAGATLQNMVQDMASAKGASLVSVESLPAEAAGAYRRIGLKISLNAPWPVLIGLLQSVDQATPPMLVDDLQIHGSPLSLINRATGLEAGLTIYAFRAGTAAEAKP
ncbi:MAG TPA: type II secretion system protein GspM [Aliidongia sp.]|nr:type II secretion system protein GspM [Aliidongia sp.]